MPRTSVPALTLALWTALGTALATALLPVTPAVADEVTGVTDTASCSGDHQVTAWSTSPTDAVTPVDANGGPTPGMVHDQSVRMAVTPHRGGDTLRVRLSNLYGLTPVTFGHTTVGRQISGAQSDTTVPLTFGGQDSVTLAPGEEITSDDAALDTESFGTLLVSAFIDGSAGPPTQHWNANATSYLTDPGAGDHTADTAADAYRQSTGAWLYVTGLEVTAPADVGTLVAFGDSITDGFVGTSPVPVPADASVNDTSHRYPDALQRRFDAAGAPVTVANAGIGSNQLLTGAEPLFLGEAGVDRFRRDVLDQPGVYGTIVLIGINDLGLNPFVTTGQMIDGYRNLVAQARERGTKIWLGTILPASDALVDGTLLSPQSNRMRTEINDWIRSQDIADGYVDFDAAVRSPEDPSVLDPQYSGPDRLHPNPAGYEAMADAVDLGMVGQPPRACG